MKKLIILFLGLIFSFIATAQTVGGITAFVNDTTTDAETLYMGILSPVAILGDYTQGIYIKATTATGTATVTATNQVSNDASTWYNKEAATTIVTSGTALNYAWLTANTPYRYYRVKIVSSGSGVTYLTGGMVLKRKQ